LGGSLLEIGGSIVPPYYDPKYKCEMELLRFDSRKPNAKYAGLVELLGERLQNVSVVTSHALHRGAEGSTFVPETAMTPFAA
jgi:hypothetical protein